MEAVPAPHARSLAATYERAPGDEVKGRVEAINILTATHVGLRARMQAIGFWLARRPEWQAKNLAGTRPQAVQLKRLNFIHTARWVHIGRFPRFRRSSQLRRTREPFLPYRWTLFASNLNQGWEPYLQAFLDSFGGGIHTLWGDSLDYPGYPRPQTRSDMNEWIQYRLPISQAYYSAYPHLTTNDVRSMLRIDREVRSYDTDSQSADVDVNDGDRAALRTRLQHCVLDWPDSPDGWGEPGGLPHRGPEWATGITGFVSLMPLQHGTERAVRDELEALNGPCQSHPFARVPGTHFARLAVLDRARAATYPGRDLRLRRSWLLFCADFDAFVDERELRRRRRPRGHNVRTEEFRRYFGEVVRTPELRAVLDHCYPRPATDLEVVDDLIESVCQRRVYFRDYPDTTLGAILDAERRARDFE